MTEYFIPGVGHVAGAYRTSDGIQRPANWLALATPEERAAEGAVPRPVSRAGERVVTATDGWTVRPMTADEAAALRRQRVAEVKAEAARRILAMLPDWKQRNLALRAAELAEKGRAGWTAEDVTEWEAAVAAWERVRAVRAASDAIEAAVTGLAAADLDAYTPAADPRWP